MPLFVFLMTSSLTNFWKTAIFAYIFHIKVKMKSHQARVQFSIVFLQTTQSYSKMTAEFKYVIRFLIKSQHIPKTWPWVTSSSPNMGETG